ncbi:MAG TPA: putative peptidoglycan glycosyltransferase FtsW [Bacteroidales bacterium]|nr:putative peptidoglycan glycosyltransferase FtsW [Bacteroidales bacterium]
MLEFLRKNIKGDRVIWTILAILAGYSILAVYSASGTLAYKYFGGNAAHYLMRQLAMLFVGFLIIFFCHRIPYKYFSKLSQIAYYISIFLLAVTLLWGMSLNEASRWIALPGGITFQTSDFAKIALIMYLARTLSVKEEEIKTFKGTLRHLILPMGIICGLIFPANISTSILLFGTCMLLLFVGQVKFKYLLMVVGIGIAGVGLFVLITMVSPVKGRIDTAKSRIEAFMNPESESNFQADQAKIAIASAGVLGKGPGNSVQRNVLPHPYSDFIFAIIVEEYGYIFGAMILVALFVFLFYRVILIVKKVDRKFGAFSAMGLGMMLVFQAFSHMAVAVNLFPTTGQTLPFVSMGGTSIIFLSIAIGVILSISREVNEAEAQKKKDLNQDENETEIPEENLAEETQPETTES